VKLIKYSSISTWSYFNSLSIGVLTIDFGFFLVA
jgi:hypothetical protein